MLRKERNEDGLEEGMRRNNILHEKLFFNFEMIRKDPPIQISSNGLNLTGVIRYHQDLRPVNILLFRWANHHHGLSKITFASQTRKYMLRDGVG